MVSSVAQLIVWKPTKFQNVGLNSSWAMFEGRFMFTVGDLSGHLANFVHKMAIKYLPYLTCLSQ